MQRFPKLIYNQEDIEYLKESVPNKDGLAVFCYKRANNADLSKFFLGPDSLLKLSNGQEYVNFAKKLDQEFNPLSLFVGFTSPVFPDFCIHNHYRKSFDHLYRFHNVFTVGCSNTDGEVLQVDDRQVILNKEFSFSFSNKAMHGVKVRNEFSIFFIMDDIDFEIAQKTYPQTLKFL